MRVYIWNCAHDTYYSAQVSANVTVGQLLELVVSQIFQPRLRQLVCPRFYLVRSGEQPKVFPNCRDGKINTRKVVHFRVLHPEKTLAQLDVLGDEVLCLAWDSPVRSSSASYCELYKDF